MKYAIIWHWGTHYIDENGYPSFNEEEPNCYEGAEGESKDALLSRLIREEVVGKGSYLFVHIAEKRRDYSTINIDYIISRDDPNEPIDIAPDISLNAEYQKQLLAAKKTLAEQKAAEEKRRVEAKECAERETYERLRAKFEAKTP